VSGRIYEIGYHPRFGIMRALLMNTSRLTDLGAFTLQTINSAMQSSPPMVAGFRSFSSSHDLQNRLVKEMRVLQRRTIEQANRFLEITFWPDWSQRYTVQPAQSSDPHRKLQRE